MKCIHCRFMEKTNMFSSINKKRLRYCRIKLPPQVKTTGNIQLTIRSGCDLGQPKEEKANR